MEGEATGGGGGDFLDWELLHESDSPTSVRSLRNYEAIEDVSEGMIQVDYFSIDGSSRYAKNSVAASEEGCDSDNPSWIDPAQFSRKNSGEFWSDSGSDRSDEHRKVVEFGSGPLEKAGDFGFDVSKLSEFSVESEIVRTGFEGLGEIKQLDHDSDKNKFWSDSGGDELVEVNKVDGNELTVEAKQFNDQNSKDHAIQEVKVGGDEEKRSIVWWKVPFELLRYCVLRAGPVCSFSVAAAFVGFVILGRKLYRMKHKSRSLQLKVTLDDKKVSQFMTRAARLNEAFSVVRRVPMIRPALPPTGFAQWSTMGLR